MDDDKQVSGQPAGQDYPQNSNFEQESKGSEEPQVNQWPNAAMTQGMVPGMTSAISFNPMNGMNGINGMNGMFPMDFSQMMPNGMSMPVGGFPGMMSKHIFRSHQRTTLTTLRWNGHGPDDESNVTDVWRIWWTKHGNEWHEHG